MESDGTTCELCGSVAEVREHRQITAKQLNKAFYYSRWYYCNNPKCSRNVFMKKEHEVWNQNEAAAQVKMFEQSRDQAAHIRNIALEI